MDVAQKAFLALQARLHDSCRAMHHSGTEHSKNCCPGCFHSEKQRATVPDLGLDVVPSRAQGPRGSSCSALCHPDQLPRGARGPEQRQRAGRDTKPTKNALSVFCGAQPQSRAQDPAIRGSPLGALLLQKRCYFLFISDPCHRAGMTAWPLPNPQAGAPETTRLFLLLQLTAAE